LFLVIKKMSYLIFKCFIFVFHTLTI